MKGEAMPKIISEHERLQTKTAIIQQTIQLIQAKNGIKDITVDDIVRAVGIGKSSFYTYFKSKEECLFEVIECDYIDTMKKAEEIAKVDMPLKEKITKYFRDFYLPSDSISNYISPTELQVLFRKLPLEYDKRIKGITEGALDDLASIMHFSKSQAETASALFNCVDFVATMDTISDDARNAALDFLISAIGEYLEQNHEAHDY